jgi:hypothetical protein
MILLCSYVRVASGRMCLCTCVLRPPPDVYVIYVLRMNDIIFDVMAIIAICISVSMFVCMSVHVH